MHVILLPFLTTQMHYSTVSRRLTITTFRHLPRLLPSVQSVSIIPDYHVELHPFRHSHVASLQVYSVHETGPYRHSALTSHRSRSLHHTCTRRLLKLFVPFIILLPCPHIGLNFPSRNIDPHSTIASIRPREEILYPEVILTYY